MEDKQYDIIVVGAGPAGLTAAIYGRRAGKSVLVLEKETFGGQMTRSPKIENYPGFPVISGVDLGERLMGQTLQLGAEMDVDNVTDVVDFGDCRGVITERGQYIAKTVIIAAGSKPRTLGLEKEDVFTGNGVSYCVLCDGAFYADMDVAIVGGGNTALQSAVLLADTCRKVTIIQNLPQLTGEQTLIDNLTARDNVTVVYNTIVLELQGTDSLISVKLRNTELKTDSVLPVKGLFVAIGQVPENEPFAMVAELDKNGYIVAGEDCKTSTPGVFVAGDCRTKNIRQIATAAGDGAAAALAACRFIDSGK